MISLPESLKAAQFNLTKPCSLCGAGWLKAQLREPIHSGYRIQNLRYNPAAKISPRRSIVNDSGDW
jgi:hypothetical protein